MKVFPRCVLPGLVALCVMLPQAAAAADPTTAPTAKPKTVYAATLRDGMINPASEDYIIQTIRQAREARAAAVILRIDTPGGMLQSTRTIVKAILGAEIPVITYVTPAGAHAGSAGVFITMAGHVAAMAPGTNIGAAHPVGGQGEDIDKAGGEDLATKVVEDTRAFIESIAKQRGRNAEWGARAVTESVSITAEKAVELRVVDWLAANDEELLEKADGMTVRLPEGEVILDVAGAVIVEVEMSLKQRLVDFLANPNVAYLLLTLGFLGIYFELSNPGMIFPGVIGGLSLVLAFVALQVMPFNAAGLALIAIAIVLFVLEAFVTSFGLLTIGGVIAMTLGGILLFDTPEADMSIDLSVLLPVAILMGLAALGISYLVGKALRSRVETGSEGMIGKIGRSMTPLSPRGSVFVSGEIWSAVADSVVEKDMPVIVTGIDGLVLRVSRAEPETTLPPQGGDHA